MHDNDLTVIVIFFCSGAAKSMLFQVTVSMGTQNTTGVAHTPVFVTLVNLTASGLFYPKMQQTGMSLI